MSVNSVMDLYTMRSQHSINIYESAQSCHRGVSECDKATVVCVCAGTEGVLLMGVPLSLTPVLRLGHERHTG